MEKTLKLKKNRKEIKLIADALSNENRLKILQHIKSSGESISHKELSEKLGIKSASISFHLAPLIDCGIISEEIGKGLKGRNKKVPKIILKKIVIEL